MKKINTVISYILDNKRPRGLSCPLCGRKALKGQSVLWLYEIDRFSFVLHKSCMQKTVNRMEADSAEELALMAKDLMETVV